MAEQLEMINNSLHVFELPPMTVKVFLQVGVDGQYYIYFEAVGGLMVLGKKSSIGKALGFVKIDSAVKRLNQLGWYSDVLIKRGF